MSKKDDISEEIKELETKEVSDAVEETVKTEEKSEEITTEDIEALKESLELPEGSGKSSFLIVASVITLLLFIVAAVGMFVAQDYMIKLNLEYSGAGLIQERFAMYQKIYYGAIALAVGATGITFSSFLIYLSFKINKK